MTAAVWRFSRLTPAYVELALPMSLYEIIARRNVRVDPLRVCDKLKHFIYRR
jgi:hypothetical protein